METTLAPAEADELRQLLNLLERILLGDEATSVTATAEARETRWDAAQRRTGALRQHDTLHEVAQFLRDLALPWAPWGQFEDLSPTQQLAANRLVRRDVLVRRPTSNGDQIGMQPWTRHSWNESPADPTWLLQAFLQDELAAAVTAGADEGPKESAATTIDGYLGLIVNEGRGEVRRPGHNRGNAVTFATESAEWHTFLTAWRAKENGATAMQWQTGYPGEWVHRRKRKAAAGEKLAVLGISFEHGPHLKLRDESSRLTGHIVP